MPLKSFLRLLGLPALALLCGPAFAHDGLGASTPLWNGALHFLTSPLSLAALAGGVALLHGVDARMAYLAALLAGLAACTGSALAPALPQGAVPAVLVLLGLCALSGWTPKTWAGLLLAALAGATAGAAADVDTPTWQAGLGVGLVMMLGLQGALALLRQAAGVATLAGVLPIGRRVLGSWVAAAGLLLFTLALKTP